jgi:histidinol-phosphatase (PHP family)
LKIDQNSKGLVFFLTKELNLYTQMLDYHIHTKFCGHASGEMQEYVKYALTQPLWEIGFADHLPMLKWGKPEYAMTFKQLPEYVREVQRLQKDYPTLRIKLGIEADYYSPEDERATRKVLDQYPFDYVYGSVHFIDNWALDDPRNMHHWNALDVNTIYERYFAKLRQAARSGLFDIISHPDLVKKFGHRPTKDVSGMIENTIRCYKDSSVAVEINTSGLRKPVKEIYPAPQIIQLLKCYDVPIVFGSDAHKPQEVGRDFAFAKNAAQKFGFTKLAIFEQRKIVGTYPL